MSSCGWLVPVAVLCAKGGEASRRFDLNPMGMGPGDRWLIDAMGIITSTRLISSLPKPRRRRDSFGKLVGEEPLLRAVAVDRDAHRTPIERLSQVCESGFGRVG